MKTRLMYVELKTRYNDNGPAWIGLAFFSKSGKTIYFNGRAFSALGGMGINGNYMDLETREEYWISGVKKNGKDRHWAGNGKVQIDKSVVADYLKLINRPELPTSEFQIIELNNVPPKERINEIKNKKLDLDFYKNQ